jgi:hypothetical protein
VEDLLLLVYGGINEPDGIYAVAHSHELACQIRLYEHEGDWELAGCRAKAFCFSALSERI